MSGEGRAALGLCFAACLGGGRRLAGISVQLQCCHVVACPHQTTLQTIVDSLAWSSLGRATRATQTPTSGLAACFQCCQPDTSPAVCRPGYAHTFVLHCSLAPATGKMFVHGSEAAAQRNMAYMGLIVDKYVPDLAACAGSAWEGELHGARRVLLKDSWWGGMQCHEGPIGPAGISGEHKVLARVYRFVAFLLSRSRELCCTCGRDQQSGSLMRVSKRITSEPDVQFQPGAHSFLHPSGSRTYPFTLATAVARRRGAEPGGAGGAAARPHPGLER